MHERASGLKRILQTGRDIISEFATSYHKLSIDAAISSMWRPRGHFTSVALQAITLLW
jgi:hypothetical protein